MELNDDDKYLDEWSRMMVEIFQEKVSRLDIMRTGALFQSFRSRVQEVAEGKEVVTSFLTYGVFVAEGTGYGYTRGNGGDLEFLDPQYRKEHRLDRRKKVGPAWGGYRQSGKPRKARDWFSRKWYMSVRNAVERLALITGEQAVQVVCDSVDDTRKTLREL